jgi:thiol-disulfide isomerase/thioredoxin
MKKIKNELEYKKSLKGNSVIIFGNELCLYCQNLISLVPELESLYSDINFYYVDQHNYSPFKVDSIPYLIFIKNSKKIKEITGLNLDEIIETLEKIRK